MGNSTRLLPRGGVTVEHPRSAPVSPLLLASFLVEATTAQKPTRRRPRSRRTLRRRPGTDGRSAAHTGGAPGRDELQVAAPRGPAGHLVAGSGSTVVTSGYYGYGGGRAAVRARHGRQHREPPNDRARARVDRLPGPMRLTVPDYLTLVGDDRADDVDDIRSARTTGTLFTAIGVAGVGAVVAGSSARQRGHASGA